MYAANLNNIDGILGSKYRLYFSLGLFYSWTEGYKLDFILLLSLQMN